MSRATKAYVSAYDRSSVLVGQVRRQEVRPVVADLNAILEAGETIESVTWLCVNPWVCAMSDAAIEGRTVKVTANFQFGGFTSLRATVTTSEGNKYSQVFQFTVRDGAFWVENPPVAAGPFSLTATAS